jgi:phenylpropionate dioxygenase-like ring-hydroxylating dioxygenase large terminal subunit
VRDEYESQWLATMAGFWHVVARSADLAAGAVVPVTLLGRALALWRTAEGELGLVDERCPHRGVALSLGSVTAGGCLRCPYHSWEFDRAGECTRIPQLDGRILPGARTPAWSVREADGFVWACASDSPRREPPAIPELAAGTHWFWMGETIDWRAQNLRQVENFCDVAHFSVIHVDTFGNPAGLRLEPTAAGRDGWALRFRFDYPTMDPTAPAGPDRPVFDGVFDYHVELPCSVLLRGASGPGSVMFIHSTPVDVYRTRLFWGTAFPHGTEIDGDEYAAIEDRIWSPDLAMVESQRPRGLPVDLTPELHLPHDRASVALRRALADLGIPAPPR